MDKDLKESAEESKTSAMTRDIPSEPKPRVVIVRGTKFNDDDLEAPCSGMMSH